MSSLIKIIISLLAALLFTSCAIDFNMGQIRGNGNVVEENLNISNDFDRIHAANGWEVILEKGDDISVRLEADENLVDAAEIYVKNNTLKIYCENNIGRATSKKVFVTYIENLSEIKASSGAHLLTSHTLKGERLAIDVSSGGYIKTDAVVRNIDTDVSSGGSVKLSGSTESLEVDVSSGGTINAQDLRAKYADASASSGGAIDVYVTDRLKARASSGGDIDYWGNPEEVDKPKKSMSGGSVSSKD